MSPQVGALVLVSFVASGVLLLVVYLSLLSKINSATYESRRARAAANLAASNTEGIKATVSSLAKKFEPEVKNVPDFCPTCGHEEGSHDEVLAPPVVREFIDQLKEKNSKKR
jgi:hypothetical protein